MMMLYNTQKKTLCRLRAGEWRIPVGLRVKDLFSLARWSEEMIRFNYNVYHGLNTAPKSCLGILRTQRFLRKSSRTNRPAWCYHTVDGRNAAAVDMVNTQYFRSYRSVVCSFRGMLENSHQPPGSQRYVPGTHPLTHASGPRHRTPHASLQQGVGFSFFYQPNPCRTPWNS